MNAAHRDDTPVGRRMLAAVSFADVVDYSAMMAADQAGTHASWMAVLSGVVRPLADRHNGVVIKSTGDGVLARFGSALDAVEWAEAVQRELLTRAGKHQVPIELRISVHLGDVIATADDIFGDGVNVAARLLEHAAPGAVVLSEAVHDLVRGSVGGRAADLGLRNLKSFERPVRIYQLLPERSAPSSAGIRAGHLPSIAVLPFGSAHPDDAYFAEGVAEDIVISLAGLGELLVISRGSTLSVGPGAPDVREIGRALNVRYVLMGSVRRSPRVIRVRAQLCDSMDGSTIWTHGAEVAPGDLFDMQDSIVARIVAGLAPNVRSTELRRALRKRPDSFTAYDHMLRGLHLLHSSVREEFSAALGCLEAAMTADSYFAMPFAWAAYWHMMNWGQGWAADPDDEARRAGNVAARAIELDPNNALALAIYGHLKSFLAHEYETALRYLERAVAACPNNHLAQLFMACTLAYTGEGERAVQHSEFCLRLSPLDRSIYYSHTNLCLAHYANGSFYDAVLWGRLAIEENPTFTSTHRLLIGALVGIGEIAEARDVARNLLRIEPDFSVQDWVDNRQPFRDLDFARSYAERLRIAGLP